MRDRVFFYGSARYARVKWDRVNKVSVALPDESARVPKLYGKLTASPATGQQLTGTFRYHPNHVDNFGLTSDFAPSVASTTDNGSRIATADWALFLTPRSSVSARYLYLQSTNESVPVKNLGYLPAFNPRDPASMGQYDDPTQARPDDGRASQFTNVRITAGTKSAARSRSFSRPAGAATP